MVKFILRSKETRLIPGKKYCLLLLVLLTLLIELFVTPSASAAQSVNGLVTPTVQTDQITPIPPLKFTFPDSAAKPVTSWRPPLFPVPFALGPHDHFYLDRPIAVTDVNWPLPAYRYGYQDAETASPHTGVDIDAPLHTPILAAGDGKVVFTGYGLALGAGNTADPYGLAVVIRHDFSYSNQSIMTVYAHMEKILVTVGQAVKTGDQIGLVGMTGNTSGPHLHFEVRLEKNGSYSVQNPELWLAPPTDCGVLVGQFIDNYGYFINSRQVWINSDVGNHSWTVYTYASQTMQNDPYYSENLVLGDLPVGSYTITFLNNYQYYKYQIKISPGAITYIHFSSDEGFSKGQPAPVDSSTFLVPIHK